MAPVAAALLVRLASKAQPTIQNQILIVYLKFTNSRSKPSLLRYQT
jgi:hypothetical protein